MLTIHSEYLTGLIISQWDFVSIELIQIARYEKNISTKESNSYGLSKRVDVVSRTLLFLVPNH